MALLYVTLNGLSHGTFHCKWNQTGSVGRKEEFKRENYRQKKSCSTPGTKSRTSHLGNKWIQIFSRHSSTILWACMSDQACEDSYQKHKWHRKGCHGCQAFMHCFPWGFHDLLGDSPSYCHWVGYHQQPRGTVLHSCCCWCTLHPDSEDIPLAIITDFTLWSKANTKIYFNVFVMLTPLVQCSVTLTRNNFSDVYY